VSNTTLKGGNMKHHEMVAKIATGLMKWTATSTNEWHDQNGEPTGYTVSDDSESNFNPTLKLDHTMRVIKEAEQTDCSWIMRRRINNYVECGFRRGVWFGQGEHWDFCHAVCLAIVSLLELEGV